MSQPKAQPKAKTGYAYLASQYFALCGAIRKALTGNGRDNSNAAAEAVIAGATVKVEGSNRIYFKDSVAQLRAAYETLKPQEAVKA